MSIYKPLNAILICILLTFVACNDPLDNVTEFDLRINNQTEVEYHVYESATELTGGAFRNVGTVAPMESIRIRRLIVNVRYTFRLVPGTDTEQYDFQQVIQSPGDDITWTVP